MTSNVRNRAIAHLSFRAGGAPFCRSIRAHIVINHKSRGSWTVCKRCEAKAAKMKALSDKKAAQPYPGHRGPCRVIVSDYWTHDLVVGNVDPIVWPADARNAERLSYGRA